MPRPGPQPSTEPVRRRNKPAHEWTEVEGVPFEDAPELAGRWKAATKRWWSAISTMPHCVLWETSDWQFAKETAVVSDAFHGGNIKAATELRQREKIMGVTADSRVALRIRYVETVASEKGEKVLDFEAYKESMGE